MKSTLGIIIKKTSEYWIIRPIKKKSDDNRIDQNNCNISHYFTDTDNSCNKCKSLTKHNKTIITRNIKYDPIALQCEFPLFSLIKLDYKTENNNIVVEDIKRLPSRKNIGTFTKTKRDGHIYYSVRIEGCNNPFIVCNIDYNASNKKVWKVDLNKLIDKHVNIEYIDLNNIAYHTDACSSMFASDTYTPICLQKIIYKKCNNNKYDCDSFINHCDSTTSPPQTTNNMCTTSNIAPTTTISHCVDNTDNCYENTWYIVLFKYVRLILFFQLMILIFRFVLKIISDYTCCM